MEEKKRCCSPPPKGMLKLNVDASFNQHRSLAYARIIIRNENGNVITGITKSFLTSSPLQAEALALREDLVFAESIV